MPVIGQDFAPAPSATEGDNEINKIIERLGIILESADLASDRANRLEVRLMGSPLLANKCTSTAPKPVPSGAISVINEKLDGIVSRLSDLRDTLDHLDTVA